MKTSHMLGCPEKHCILLNLQCDSTVTTNHRLLTQESLIIGKTCLMMQNESEEQPKQGQRGTFAGTNSIA